MEKESVLYNEIKVSNLMAEIEITINLFGKPCKTNSFISNFIKLNL